MDPSLWTLFIISFEEDEEVMSKVFNSQMGNPLIIDIWVTSRCDTSQKTKCVVSLDIIDPTGLCPLAPCPVDPNPWCGYAVVTCTTVQGTSDEFTGHTAAIIDIRKNSRAARGDSWTLPVEPGKDTVRFIRPEAWRINQIGNVYGIALNPHNADIFLAASDIYDFDFQQFVTVGPPPPSVSGPAGPGGIYKSNLDNPEVTNVFIATTSVYPSPENFDAMVIGSNIIPNTGNDPDDPNESGNGIGNIDYGLKSNHIYASNLEDGKLYSINATTGRITDVFDPFNPYVHSSGMVTPAERIWGVQVRDCGLQSRLYFARSTRFPSNVPDIIDPKEIWSVAINSDGTFAGTERIELIVDRGDMSKITDMAFNANCDEILVAERGNAHSAEMNRYKLIPDDTWVHDRQFFLGLFDPTNTTPIYPTGIRGNSAAGGVAYGPVEEECVVDAICDQLVWGTTNCGDIAADDDLDPPTPFECRTYGAQGIDAAGNTLETNKRTDIFVGFDTDFTDNNLFLKSNIGDIEIFNCCCPFEPGRNPLDEGIRAMVGGEIYTEENYRVEHTAVQLYSNNQALDMMTNRNGEYMFEALEMHHDYTISPQKTGDIFDGLSTLDLVLIQRHILSVDPLDSPYKIIAADVNEDQKVSVQDLTILKRIILGLLDGGQLTHWTFVPADHQFASPELPFPYPGDKILNDLDDNWMHEDFIAIKLGDVNGDNHYNKLANPRRVHEEALIITIDNDMAHFSLDRDMSLSGLQINLEIEKGTLGSVIQPGLIEPNAHSYVITDNQVQISWTSPANVSVSQGEILFSIPLSSVEESSKFEFANGHLQTELYDDKYTRIPVRLDHQKALTNGYEVVTAPNPFENATNLIFDIEKDETVSFEFYNVDGKEVFSFSRQLNKGSHSIPVDFTKSRLTGNQIIFYKITFSSFTATGKLFKVAY